MNPLNNPIIITMLIPLFGMLALFLLNKNNTKTIKSVALGISVVTFLYSLFLFSQFDITNPDYQFYFEEI